MRNNNSHTSLIRRRAKSSSSSKEDDSIKASTSSPLTIKVNSASSCSSLPISWDATTGTAPWTVMIALTDNLPYSFTVPSDSGSSTLVNWNVPKLAKTTQALVSVSDSTGATSGVSSFITINAGTGNCASPQDDLDFVWFPNNNQNNPAHCSNWGLSWQTDTGNKGVQGQISFTFLPQNGQPLTVNAGTGASGSFNFPVPFAAGTQFLVIANDHGSSGTGGVGDLQSVATTGGAKNCNAPSNVGNGLPSASSSLTVASPSTSAISSTTKSNSKTSTRTSTSASTGPTTAGSSLNGSTSDHKSNTTGTAVGATFGVLGALALLGILIWWLRRKHKEKEDEQRAWGGAPAVGAYNGAPANGYDGVSPWRWSAAPYEAPQTNSRASKWLKRVSGSAAAATGIRNLGKNASGSHDQPAEQGQSAQPYMQQANLRNLTVPNDNYALSSMGAGSFSSDFPRSPSPAHSQGMMGIGAGQNVHSTVPDTALFPPPGPRSYGGYDEGGYGLAKQQGRQQERSPFADPVRATGEVMSDGSQSPLSEIRKGTTYDAQTNSSPVGRNLLHGRKGSSSVGGSSGSGHGTYDGLGSDYIAPLGPTNTSIHDPYTHMSQLWDPNSHGEAADRMNHGRSYSNSSAGAGVQRVKPPILSEVMMPHQPTYKFTKTGQRRTDTEPIDEDDEGLPYL